MKPISIPEILLSVIILSIGYALVFYWQNKAMKDKAKRKYPSADVYKLDEFEKKIS